MTFLSRNGWGIALISAALTFGAVSSQAATVTYKITAGGTEGTFDAPDVGGVITAISIVIGGVLFDSIDTDNVPFYDIVDNDLQGSVGLFGYATNSAASGGCAAMSCLLEFEDSSGMAPPKLYAAFPLEGGIAGEVFAAGEYDITPPPAIPLPPTLILALTALAGLFGVKRLKSAAT